MHELSLMSDLLAKVEEIAEIERVKKVSVLKVKIGAKAHISSDHFREHFVLSSQGTIAEGARLDIEILEDVNDPQAHDVILESVEAEC